jgi:3-phenylpropionate/cinnamic acid dioxygenase small subunit
MSSQPKIQGSATEWAETLDGAPAPRKGRPPQPHVKVSPELKMEIEEFLYRQAEILDDKRWDEWLALFTEDGTYWVPVTEDQTVADGVPNIFYEDLDLMRVRAKRVSHPRAWSQKPPHRTTHTVSNVVVEKHDAKTGDLVVRSKFTMSEFRRDITRAFAGKYRHELKKTKDGYRIRQQRVDLVNGEGPWEYVLQTWV